MENKKRYNVMLKPSIVDELDRLAIEWGTSRSEMIAKLVQIHKGDSFLDMAVELHERQTSTAFMP